MKELVLRSNCQKLINTIFCLFFVICIQAQTLNVIDEKGQGLPGVLAFDESRTFTQVSDLNGQIPLANLNKSTKITFQFLGYVTLEKTITELSEIGFSLVMLPESKEIDEVIIIGRTDARKDEVPFEVQSISQKEIRLTNPQTSADALAQHSNIFVQKSQMGGGSPVLRGFEANKILLVVDGVRMNNAIYRNGHLQNAITIDQSLMERTEVIFGPGSLTYGSDALGGVIHFRSRNPKLQLAPNKNWNIKTNTYARFATANKEKTIHADINIGNKKWAQLISYTQSDFGDLRSGNNRWKNYPDFGRRDSYAAVENGQDIEVINDDPNVQLGTSYQQYDLMYKLLYQVNEDLQVIGNFQYSTSSDIPRYDQLIAVDDNDELSFSEWYYGPQKRLLASTKINWYKSHKLFDKILIIPSFQSISEDRIDRRFGSETRSTQKETVDVFGLTIDFNKTLGANRFSYGLDWQNNQVQSDAYDENILSNESISSLSRYPSDKSQMSMYGAYLQLGHEIIPGEMQINSGIRYNYSNLFVQYKTTDPITWPSSFINGLESNNQSLTASLGLNYNPENFEVRLLLASAFRSPNIDDMAKIRIKNNEITVPNVNLDPEKSYTAEITLAQKWDNKKSWLSITGFYTLLRDAILREQFSLPDGTNFIIDEGDTLITVSNVNAQSGKIFGLSANVTISVFDGFDLSSSINYTKGRATDNNTEKPLSHIPPLYGKVNASYQFNDFQSSLTYRFNGTKALKDYGDSTDNLENATPEGTPFWSTLNLYNSYDWNQMNFTLGVENIFDMHYRPFASGVSAPGRNFIFAIRCTL